MDSGEPTESGRTDELPGVRIITVGVPGQEMIRAVSVDDYLRVVDERDRYRRALALLNAARVSGSRYIEEPMRSEVDRILTHVAGMSWADGQAVAQIVELFGPHQLAECRWCDPCPTCGRCAKCSQHAENCEHHQCDGEFDWCDTCEAREKALPAPNATPEKAEETWVAKGGQVITQADAAAMAAAFEEDPSTPKADRMPVAVMRDCAAWLASRRPGLEPSEVCPCCKHAGWFHGFDTCRRCDLWGAPHFVPTSTGPRWRGKYRCAYCNHQGWPLFGSDLSGMHWSLSHGAACARSAR